MLFYCSSIKKAIYSELFFQSYASVWVGGYLTPHYDFGAFSVLEFFATQWSSWISVQIVAEMELIFHIATLTVLCLESIDNTALFWVPLRSAGKH